MSSALQHQHSVTSTPLSGSHLRMIDMIGVGTSGTVFRAELNTETGPRHVALKVPHRGCDLRREASIMRRFPHPNIASLLNEPATSSDPLIVELCNQGTLEDRMIDQPLQLREVVELVSAVGRALALLHDAGWIHGDVNPSNIGLRSKGVPCLLDFGCARPADGSQPSSGTSEYSGDSIMLVAELDVRSLAASARAALSPVHESVCKSLDQFVNRADSGHAVTIEQLIELLQDSSEGDPLAPLFPADAVSTANADSPRETKPSAGGPADPPRPRTREFGPRPQPPASEPMPTNNSEPLHRRPVGLLLLVLAFFGVLTLSSGSNDLEPLEPVALFEQRTPAATLDDAGATWSNSGVLTVEIDGHQRTFAAGETGDVAAIADWNCDGSTTLGIYRPGTGAWFTFATWSAATTSSVETLHEPNFGAGELTIHIDGAGCAHPAIA